MATYQSHQPFLYFIGWTELNVWYLGVRYGKGCSPLDLWTTYFTSSRRVADLREWYGEPDHVEVIATGSSAAMRALELECFSEFGLDADARWLNGRTGRPLAEDPKKQVTLRLDREVLDQFRAGGPGWQTRINEALRAALQSTQP
jgi:uncharacterized protein (DUF4415 family)